MERIKINLATFAYRGRGLEISAIGIISIIVIVVSGYLIHLSFSYQEEIINYSNRIALLEERLKKASPLSGLSTEIPKEKDVRKLRSEIELAVGLIKQDIFPWANLLDEIETCLPSGIFLDSIIASLEHEDVVLKGRAESMEKISLFLRALEHSRFFAKTVLAKFTAPPGSKQSGYPNKTPPVSFEIKTGINGRSFFARDVEGKMGPKG